MADVEELVLSVSADVRQMQRALKRMETDTNRSTRAMERQFDNMGRHVEQSARSFNSISSGVGSARSAVDAAMRSSTASIQNLRFQLNDIATGLASGQSPLVILSQQAGQVTQALSGAGGLIGTLRMIGLAVANPFTIATVAITTLAGLTTAYFSDTSKDADEANRKLEEHRTAIKAAIDAWEGAPPRQLVEYNNELERLAQLDKQRAGLREFIDSSLKPLDVAADNLSVAFEELFGRLQARNADPALLGALKRDFDRITAAVRENRATVEDLEPLYTRLKEAETALGTTRGFDQLSAAVQNMMSLIRTLNGELAETRELADNLGKPRQVLPDLGGLGPVTSEGGQFRFPATDLSDWNDQGEAAGEAWMSGLYGHLTSGQAKSHIDNLNKDFATRLSAFLGAAPGRIEIFSGHRSIERQAELWQEALRKYGSAEAARKWVAPPGNSRHNMGEAADLRFSTDAVREWAHANAEAYGLVFRLQNEQWHVELQRTDATRDRAEATRDAWADLRKETVDTTAATKAATAEYNAFGQVAATALNGLANALADGKIEGRELLQILVQVAQQLLTMPRAPGTGLFGGAASGGLLGGLLIPGILHKGGVAGQDGYGHGRAVPASVFRGARKFHKGGLVPGEVPAILQRGEVVLPRGMRMGSQPQNVHVTVGVSADANGNLMPFVQSVTQTAIRQSVPGIVSASVKTVRHQMPKLMSEAQVNAF
jgi:hypothetical protein